jgi:hypothetical protein
MIEYKMAHAPTPAEFESIVQDLFSLGFTFAETSFVKDNEICQSFIKFPQPAADQQLRVVPARGPLVN